MSRINISELIRKLERSGVSDTMIQQIVGAAATAGSDLGLSRDASPQEIQQRVEEIQKLLQENRRFLKDVIDVEDEVANIEEEEMNLLKNIIDKELLAGDMTSERLNKARKRYKQLAKNKKQRDALNQGLAKGDAMADSLLQSTLGINREFAFLNKKGGMKGLFKGFAKGLMASLGPANIVISMMQKIFESIMGLDADEAEMFRKAGIKRGTVDIRRGMSELRGMKVGLRKDLKQANIDLKTNFRSYVELGSEEIHELTKTMTVLKAVGVKNQESAEMFAGLTKSLEFTAPMARHIMVNFQAAADALGRPPQEMVRDFNEANPILARFGKKSVDIFKETATAATFLNMDVKKVISMGESMDTFEGAAKAAQAFNVALGQPFLSAQALLAAETPSDKLQLLADAYNAAGRPDLSPRMRRALSSQIDGISPDQLTRVLGLNKDKMARRSAAAEGASTTMQTVQDLVLRNQTGMDKIMAQIERIVNNLIMATGADGILAILDGLALAMSKFADFIDRVLGAKFYGIAGAKRERRIKPGSTKVATMMERKGSASFAESLSNTLHDLTGGRIGYKGGGGDISKEVWMDQVKHWERWHSHSSDYLAQVNGMYNNPKFRDQQTGVFKKGMRRVFANKRRDLRKGFYDVMNWQDYSHLHHDIEAHMVDLGLMAMGAGPAQLGMGGPVGNKSHYRDPAMLTDPATQLALRKKFEPENMDTLFFFEVYLPSLSSDKTIKELAAEWLETNTEHTDHVGQATDVRGTEAVNDGYIQPIFNREDKFYAAKDGGAIANALDEVLVAINRLIDEKQDTNLNINERRLAQAVDAAFSYVNGGG